MTRPVRFLALVLFGVLLPWLAHAQVQASLDRTTAQLGDTVTLNLHSTSGPLPAPDLSPLSGDFEVLGRSNGSTTSFRNGQRTVEYSYGVALRPLHEGTLHIPALAVGGDSTEPLTLQVSAAGASRPDASGPVFVEASIDPDHAYVGQQLALSVKLYFTANLANASLADPRIDGVDVSRIGGDTDYQAERNGRIYNVIERRYVLVPQRAGELDIPPVQFQGDLLDPNDPDSFLGMGAPVSAQSNAVSVQVKPAPADWGSSAWLPARKLRLVMEGLPDAKTPLRVGQPFNLQMTLEATGVPFEALPELSLPALDGATAYPDKPVTGNRSDGSWVVGRRQEGFAVVPDKPGTLVIPAITVKWWNVLTDQAETATIPEHRLVVHASDGSSVPSAPARPAGSSSVAPPEHPAGASSASAFVTALIRPGGWGWVALASFGLWLLTMLGLLAWWWKKRRRTGRGAASTDGSEAPRTPRELKRAFEQAVRDGDAATQSSSLLAWAQAERVSIRNLQALSDALDAPAQREAIANLQQARFAARPTPSDRAALAAAFAPGLSWRRVASPHDDDDPLPPLYPFKLH